MNKKNIRNGGTTTAYTVYTVLISLHCVDTVYTVLTLFDNVFTVYTIQTALHCLNSSMYAYIVRKGQNTFGMD